MSKSKAADMAKSAPWKSFEEQKDARLKSRQKRQQKKPFPDGIDASVLSPLRKRANAEDVEAYVEGERPRAEWQRAKDVNGHVVANARLQRSL